MNAPLPPFSLDSEEHVLGAMLISLGAIEACSDILSARDFYRSSHGEIYTAILCLYAKGQAVDAGLVIEELTRSGKLEDAGGADRIHELAGIVPSVSNAAHHANVVRETWLARCLVTAGTEIARLGRERPGSIDELVAQADEQMLEVQGFVERKSNSVFTGKQLVEEFRYRLAHPEDVNEGVMSPFPGFLFPFKPGRMYVVGGYQGDGKSVIAVQSLRSACEDGKRVGFATLEMSRNDLIDRLVSTFGVSHTRVMSGELDGYEEIVEDALGQIDNWDFEIIDDEELDPGAIRRAQRRGKYDLLIIDHLHCMKYDHRHQRSSVGENVISIAKIARKFEIPVLLLAQLRRGHPSNPFPRPTMADFRETSEIESQAAMCLFIWRIRDRGDRTNEAELIIGKNRFGIEGFRNMRFMSRYVRFEEVR